MATLVAEGLCLPGGRPPGAPTALVAVGGSLCCGRGAEHDVHGWGAAVTLGTEARWPSSWLRGCACPGGDPPEPPRRWLLWGVRCVVAGGQSMMFMAGVRRLLSGLKLDGHPRG